jgi:hypothetical protein
MRFRMVGKRPCFNKNMQITALVMSAPWLIPLSVWSLVNDRDEKRDLPPACLGAPTLNAHPERPCSIAAVAVSLHSAICSSRGLALARDRPVPFLRRGITAESRRRVTRIRDLAKRAFPGANRNSE